MTSSAWVRVPTPTPNARLRLFCFPYAGGGASVFRSWSRMLPASLQVCPVQLPGREDRLREAPFTAMSALMEALVPAVQPFLDKPFAIFGHSLGAVVGFELARHLRRQGEAQPVRLFVSSSRAPQVPDPDPPIHTLPEPEFIDELRNLKGTPEEVFQHRELLDMMVPLLRADFAVLETYEYREAPPLDCPISALGGLDDDEVKRGELAAWRRQTTSAFTLRMFPGHHFFLRDTKNAVLRAIANDIAERVSRFSYESPQ